MEPACCRRRARACRAVAPPARRAPAAHEGLPRRRHRRDRPPARAAAARRRARGDRHDAARRSKLDGCARRAPSRGRSTRSTPSAGRGARSREAAPEAVIHQLTAIPQRIDPRKIERDFALNDRLRTEGTRILVAAAQAAGARRIIAQSIAFAYAPGPARHGPRREDPLLATSGAERASAARRQRCAELERHGARRRRHGAPLRLLLRSRQRDRRATARWAQDVARRRLPVVGGGSGVWSFIHVDDAAAATVAALDARRERRLQRRRRRAGAGLGVAARRWPRRSARRAPGACRRSLARLARRAATASPIDDPRAGRHQRAAKRELGWTPAHPSWREGFATGARLSRRRQAGLPAGRPARRPPTSSTSAERSRCGADRAGLATPEQAEAVDHDRRSRAGPVITTAVRPLAPSVRTATQRDGHVDGAQQAADERPPGSSPDVARARRGRRSTIEVIDHQRGGADEEREGRRLQRCRSTCPRRELIGACMPDEAAGRRRRAAPRSPRLTSRPASWRPTPMSTASGGSRGSHTRDHLALDQLARGVALVGRAFEQQLVVDRQQQLGLQAGVGERRVACGPSRA